MTRGLERFGEELTVAVFGASGGIGAQFVAALAADPSVRTVHAFSRAPQPSAGKVIGMQCDPLDGDDLARAGDAIAASGPLALGVSAIGTLHGEGYRPEKAFRQLERHVFEEVMRVNALGPALIARTCVPLMPKDRPAGLGLLSARVGSISDNRLGGWHSYRASKAALNMLIRGLSIELARSHERAFVVGLHPGTVDTALSEPFQRGVPEGKLFTPERSVRGMLDVLAEATPEMSGGVFDYAGERVPA